MSASRKSVIWLADVGGASDMPRNPFRDHLTTVISDEEFPQVLHSRVRSRRRGVASWLYDYEDDEITKARRICEQQTRKDLINIRDFFPDLVLSQPFCDRLPGVPVWVLLPFHNQVIVWLEPVRSSAAFTRLYGLRPDAFADLCGSAVGQGRLVPMLNASPPAFQGLRHFDRILTLRPPTLWRDCFFQRALIGHEDFLSVRLEANSLIPKRLGGRERFATLRTANRGSVRELAVSCYCQICAFGGRDLAFAAIQTSRSPEAIVDRLFYYSLALYDSFVSPLGGTYPCTREQLQALVTNAAGEGDKSFEYFPAEIGKSLIEGLPMPVPLAICNRQWWLTEGRELWKPAREALRALEASVRLVDASTLQRKRDRLAAIWKDVALEVRKSRVLKKRLTWVSTGIGIVGAMSGVLLPHLPGLISSLMASAATLSVFDVRAVYARLFRPEHLVAIVGLHDYLKDHPVLACPDAAAT